MSIEGNVTKLTVKGNSFEFGAHGEPLFTPSDIAAALGGERRTLSERSLLAGLVFYTSQSIHEYQIQFEGNHRRRATACERRHQMRLIEIDDHLVRDLRVQVQAYVEGRMARARRPWNRPPNEDFPRSFSQLAVSEFWYDGRCLACNGTAWNKGRGRECGACRETPGKRRSSNSYKADFAGVSKASWSDTWGDRFLELLTELHIWKNEFDKRLAVRTS